MSGSSNKSKKNKSANVRKVGAEVAKHPLADLVNFIEFENELTKALGASRVTGQQLELAKICLRPVILKAFTLGFESAKLKESSNLETELKQALNS